MFSYAQLRSYKQIWLVNTLKNRWIFRSSFSNILIFDNYMCIVRFYLRAWNLKWKNSHRLNFQNPIDFCKYITLCKQGLAKGALTTYGTYENYSSLFMGVRRDRLGDIQIYFENYKLRNAYCRYIECFTWFYFIEYWQ